MEHLQGYFHCLKNEETIEERIKSKGQTNIIPKAYLQKAREEICKKDLDINTIDLLESNISSVNINTINSKADQDKNIQQFRQFLSKEIT